MRTETKSGVTCQYPEQYIFTRDNNVLIFSKENGALGAVRVQLVPVSGATQGPILTYTTTSNTLTFDLSDTFRTWAGVTFYFAVTVEGITGWWFIGGTSTSDAARMTIREGRTLPTRPHDGSRAVDLRGNRPQGTFYFFRDASCVVGNRTYNVTAGSTRNANQLRTWWEANGYAPIKVNYTDGGQQPLVSPLTSNERGCWLYPIGQWQDCEPNATNIAYTDADGNQWGCCAIIVEWSEEGERREYRDPHRTTPTTLSETTETATRVTLLARNINKWLHIEDIVGSPSVSLVAANGDEVPVSVETLEVTRREVDESADYRITLLISK